MKTNLLAIALLFSFQCFAQSPTSQDSTQLISLTKVELNLNGLGVGYEVPLARKWSLNLGAGLGGGYAVGSPYTQSFFRSTWVLGEPVAFVRSELKYTYNRARRLSKSKSISNNAGNYVGFQSKYATARVFGTSHWAEAYEPLNPTLLNELHWGLQRELGGRFLMNAHLGLGYAYDFRNNSGIAYPAAGLQFAYVLSRRSLF